MFPFRIWSNYLPALHGKVEYQQAITCPDLQQAFKYILRFLEIAESLAGEFKYYRAFEVFVLFWPRLACKCL